MLIFALSTPELSINPFFDGLTDTSINLIRSGQHGEYLNVKNSAESKIIDLHNKILSDTQRTWYQPLPSHFKVTDHGHYKNQLSDITNSLNDKKHALVHDPLLCRFLPLWNALESDSVNILHYSEPLECAIKLQQKWRFPLSVGLALWESYVLDAVQHLTSSNSVLLSSKKIRNSGKRHLTSFCNNLEKISGGKLKLTDVLSLEPTDLVAELPAAYESLLEHVNTDQHEIFADLEKGKLGALKKRSLSKRSADTLEYYGQMRAGFAIMKCQHVEQKTTSDQAQQLIAQLKEQLESQQQELLASSGLAETETTPNINSQSSNNAHQNLITVKLSLRGMPPVEFLSEPDSPLIDMLHKHLVSNSSLHDEMIYLNSVGADNEAMYFMASSLLSIETQSMTQH